jgi:IclR family transcriptional regulator, KDG regulon repressor
MEYPSKSSAPNKTLVNGLSLLEKIAADPQERSIVELAKEMDLPASHIHRLLQTLVTTGYVYRSPRTRKYCIDYKTIALAGPLMSQNQLCKISRSFLRSISGRTPCSAYLLVWHQKAPFILLAEHPDSISGGIMVDWGKRVLSWKSASYKLFLALNELDPASQGVPEIALPEIREELRKIKQQSFATTGEEPASTRWAVAAPVYQGDGELCAVLGAAIDRPRLTPATRDEYIRHTREAAMEFSKSLGFKEAIPTELQVVEEAI